MSEEIKGYVHSLESFGSVDGPGVRYVIFLSGCAMRCQFCHNPDTWKMGEGQQYTPSQLLKQALRYKNYWGNKGGITVSGGEPLLQIDFLIEFSVRQRPQEFIRLLIPVPILTQKRNLLFQMAGAYEVY